MDKEILNQYIDACELIKETKADIKKLKRRRQTIVQSTVKGSMEEFPYVGTTIKVQGIAYSVIQDPGALEAQERILEERIQKAEEIKVKVEEWTNTIPVRMQRIIRLKFFEGESWEYVSRHFGKNATGESIRKEFERFMDKKK